VAQNTENGEPMDYLIEAEQLVKALDADLSKHLSEQQRRLLMGSLAKLLGRGGVRFVSGVGCRSFLTGH
jgi:hypothetical protein